MIEVSSTIGTHIAPDTPAVVAIAEGEPGCPHTVWDLYSMRCSLGGDGTVCARHGHFVREPPTALLALADADCPTCDGTGQRQWDARTRLWIDADCPNPLCDLDRPGKLLVEVRVPCEQGLIVADGWDHSWCGRTSAEPLPCDDGYRTVTGRIAVVPILRFVFGSEMGDLPEIVVHKDTVNYWDGTGRIFRLDPSHIAALADVHGHPDTWPGKWGAAFTEVRK